MDGALASPLRRVDVVASQTRIEQTAGFMVVSPDYFPMFDIQVVRGRAFTDREADEGAPVALVSAATARLLWPGLDPIGQTLDLTSTDLRSERTPGHANVRIIGVTEDVANGTMIDGVDVTCVYFATGLRTSLNGRSWCGVARISPTCGLRSPGSSICSVLTCHTGFSQSRRWWASSRGCFRPSR